MTTLKLIIRTMSLLLVFGCIMSTTEGISLSTLVFIQRLVRSQTQAMTSSSGSTSQPNWGEWSLWTMCTTTTQNGVRVRSRSCGSRACEKISGDNYEIQKCKPAGNNSAYNETYLNLCMNNPSVNNTLSCRLYRENPIMAYGIYRSAGEMNCDYDAKEATGGRPRRCLFNVVGDMPDTGEDDQSESRGNEALVFGRSPVTRLGEVGLQYLEQLDTEPLTTVTNNNEGAPTTATPSLLTRVAESALTNRICTDTCQTIVIESSQVKTLGSRAPTTVSALIQLVQTNFLIRDNSDEILRVHNNCLSSCRIWGPMYAALRITLLNRGSDPAQTNSNLRVTLNVPNQGTGTQRRKRSANMTAPIERSNLAKIRMAERVKPRVPFRMGKQFLLDAAFANKPGENPDVAAKTRDLIVKRLSYNNATTKELITLLARLNRDMKDKSDQVNGTGSSMNEHAVGNETISRKKRQVDPNLVDRFRSPCFDRTRLSTSSRVLNLDDTEGELFFYEGREQRFVKTTCAGAQLVPGKLYQPSEPIFQSNQQPAVCKQGYLKRYGLLIQVDPEGDFMFANGERFSVRFRPFKLESHCALATLREF